MPHHAKALIFTAAVTVVSFLAAGCGSRSKMAQYRVVQTIPNSPTGLDVSLNGRDVSTNVAFGATEPTAGYESAAAGSDPIDVSQTGGGTPLIGSTNLNLQSGFQYTIMLTGLYASPSVATFVDNNTPPVSEQIELRAIHASPSAPPSLDIYMVAPGIDITHVQPAVAALQFQQQSAYIPLSTLKSGYVEVLLIATAAGTKTPLLTKDYVLMDGQIRTFVLVDVSPQANALAFTPLELNDLN